jgi:hypothetical protein
MLRELGGCRVRKHWLEMLIEVDRSWGKEGPRWLGKECEFCFVDNKYTEKTFKRGLTF